MAEESDRKGAVLAEQNRELEERLRHLQQEAETATSIRDCRGLLEGLMQDYEILNELDMDINEFRKLKGVRNEEEYINRRAGTEVLEGVDLREVKNLPETFEQTTEYKQKFAHLDLDEERVIVENVAAQLREGKKVPKRFQRQAEESKTVVRDYDESIEDFEKRKQVKKRLREIEGTYNEFDQLRKRVRYREDKGERISCFLDDRIADDGKLAVSISVGLERDDKDEFSLDLTRYLTKALGIEPQDIGRHVKYEEAEKIITRRYNLRGTNRQKIFDRIRQRLEKDKPNFTFSGLGIDIEVVYRSLF